MEAQKLLGAAPFEPDVISVLKLAFERAWAIVVPSMTSDSRSDTRLRLAHAIVAHASSGERDCEALATAALASLRKHSPGFSWPLPSAVTIGNDVENDGTPTPPTPNSKARCISEGQLKDRENGEERFLLLWGTIAKELERDRLALLLSREHLAEIHRRLQRTREIMLRATELVATANGTGRPVSED